MGTGFAEVARLYDWLASAIADYGLPEALQYDLHIVAEEVVTNVAKHAFPPGQAQAFLVRVTKRTDEVELFVQDSGQPFNPVRAAMPPRAQSITDIIPGGWGIGLIRHHCQDIQYDRQDGQNRLTLRFPLKQA
jgi:anti-sigma regulatory factor (Ser/Thr protein kinase)